MELRHLRYFVAVAETGSLSQAAAKLASTALLGIAGVTRRALRRPDAVEVLALLRRKTAIRRCRRSKRRSRRSSLRWHSAWRS